jgi:hypothetical protein
MLIEAIGWMADVLFLLAYFFVSTKKLSGDGKIFNVMNLAGAVLYSSYAILKSAPPVLILEVFWGAIAVRAIYKSLSLQNKSKN